MLEIRDFNGAATRIRELNQIHVPIVILADTSSSMMGNIANLNKALASFKASIENDFIAKACIDVALIEFNSSVNILNPFTPCQDWSVPNLSATGMTQMGEAACTGFNMLLDRMTTYKMNGVPYTKGWMLLMTDGAPTDSIDEAERLIHSKKDRIHAFGLGAPGYYHDSLERLSPSGVFAMADNNYIETLKTLSMSVISSSKSKPGDQIAVPIPQNTTFITN